MKIGKLVLALFIFSACNSATAEREVDVYGVKLGMSQAQAVTIMKAQGLFQRTSWDGTVVVGSDENCHYQFMMKFNRRVEPCKNIGLHSVRFSEDGDETQWLVAEISFDQALKDSIHLEVWREAIVEKVGPLEHVETHHNTVQHNYSERYLGILHGEPERLQGIKKIGFPYSEIIEELRKKGCNEPLQFVEATAYHENEMVFGYELKLVDLQLKCREQEAVKRYQIEKSKKHADQIKLN